MKCARFCVTVVLLIRGAVSDAAELPWQVNPPIVNVQKSLYLEHPAEGAVAGVIMEYVGPNLELMESRYYGRPSAFTNWTSRRSADNGKTWSPFQPCNPSTTAVNYNGVTGNEYFVGPRCYDDQTGLLVDTYQQDLSGIAHPFWRTSSDMGATWSQPRMLPYESGPQFNPNDPLNTDYVKTNLGWTTNNIVKLSNGRILTAVGDAKPVPSGALCFIGRWDSEASDYRWTAGNPVTGSGSTSMLSEPMVAELKDHDHRVLVVYRGGSGGRKWFSTSTDGGMNLSSPAELKYDDGSSFYSPSSNCQLIRNSKTGKLYWIGNITANPPNGNLPRDPLVIAEVNEWGIPALKKSSVTLIDGQLADDPDSTTQFTNFLVYEDRETHDFILHMSLYGEHANPWNADNYRYTLTLTTPEPASYAMLTSAVLAGAGLLGWRKRRHIGA
jgi:hypothetical protein